MKTNKPTYKQPTVAKAQGCDCGYDSCDCRDKFVS
jgi:hypothetical protein